MKTPEQMAEEWSNGESNLWFAEISTYTDGHKSAVKQGFLAGYQAAKEETNLPTPAKWISVKDRLPEGGKVVLVAMPKGTVTLGGIRKKTQAWDVFLDMAIWTAEPTHWMPLPEPPEDK